MLGIMIVTAFLSMWMSNTATTAMILPVTTALVDQMFAGSSNCQKIKDSATKAMLLAVAYSANIGGTCTLIGTGSNIIMYSMLEK
jgi:solute carrier family 13 (sodium-dependent dicarboxylate transporter), member 2/3/5